MVCVVKLKDRSRPMIWPVSALGAKRLSVCGYPGSEMQVGGIFGPGLIITKI